MLEGSALEGFMQQVGSNILKLLSNFNMGSLDNLVLGLAGGRGHCGGAPSSRISCIGSFIPIPNSLEMKAQGNGGHLGSGDRGGPPKPW